jgi:hypothetical protein
MYHAWEMRNAYTILFGNLVERNSFRDLGAGGRIILKWILKIEYEGVE